MVIDVIKRPARDYQLDCVRLTLKSNEQKKYYTLPTGTGKTRVLTLLIEQLQQRGRVLVVAHRKELIEQTAASIREDIPGVDVGIVMSTQNENWCRVVVATIQTLASKSRLDDMLDYWDSEEKVSEDGFVAVLIDECHHSVPGSAYDKLINRVLEQYPGCQIIGCTATPYRSDKSKMQEVLPTCTFTRSILDMQKAGWLAPLAWKSIRIPVDLEGIGTSMLGGEKDYKSEELAQLISPQSAYIVEQTAPHFGTRPVMVFSVNVAHAYELADAYCQAGYKALGLDGNCSREVREEALHAWKSGQVQIMVNCALFTEGFDYTPIAPNTNGLGCLVIASPTMSPSRYLQMVGRGTRLKPLQGNFTDCLVFDVAGNSNLLETRQITLPRVMPTCPADPEETDQFITFDGQEEREEKEKKERKLKLVRVNDPFYTSWVSWGRKIQGNIYYTGLGRNSFDDPANYAVLFPAGDGSGLFHGVILTEFKYRWTRQYLTDQPKTLQEMMHHLNHVISQNGIRQLVDKAAAWRNKPASEKQLNWLNKLDSTEAMLASQNGENMGEVGMRINWVLMRKEVNKLLQEQQKEGNS